MMGLMTCMCLITQSCSKEEDDISKNSNDDFGFVGKPGEYSGYWMVNGEKADSCVMTYDGTSITFSVVPSYTILKKAGVLSTTLAHFGSLGGGFSGNNGEIQLQASPFVMTPKRTGYTENYFYFSNENKSKYLTETQFDGSVSIDSNLSYRFYLKFYDTRTKTEEMLIYVLVFDDENFGVFNFGQRSWAIRFFINELLVGVPNSSKESYPLNPTMELTFISND
jgi:hypothetical protein